MFPPAATGRRLPMGYRLGDYVVDYPKTDIIISSFVVHHDPEVLTGVSHRPQCEVRSERTPEVVVVWANSCGRTRRPSIPSGSARRTRREGIRSPSSPSSPATGTALARYDAEQQGWSAHRALSNPWVPPYSIWR